MGFGNHIRQEREKLGLSVREVARRLQRNATYLSKIEREELPPPSEEVIRKLAEILNQEPEGLVILAGRIPDDLLIIIRENPAEFGVLIRSLRGATPESITRLVKDGKW